MWRRLNRPATRAEVKALGEDEARAIYARQYVEPCAWVPFDELRAQLIDFSVHSGSHVAVLRLQGVLGVPPDGIVGPRTRSAITLWPWRLTNNGLVAARVQWLSDLAERDESQRAFLRGWVVRAVSFLA